MLKDLKEDTNIKGKKENIKNNRIEVIQMKNNISKKKTF